MQDKETLYARWMSGEITESELSELKEDGAIADLERIAETSKKWSLPKYNTTEGLKSYKAKYPQTTASEVNMLNGSWLIWIAAFLLLLCLVYLYINKDAPVVLIADKGATQQVLLNDGSQVTINDGSSIAYDEENWIADRSIKLTGEAFFKVENGSPFIVETKHGSVEVLGTEFSVRAWGTNLYVECYEGSVQVRTTNQKSVLVQNESINVVNSKMKIKQRINHTSPRWIEGISRFYDEEIDEVFAEIERQYDVTIKAPKLDNIFSGAFMHDDIEKALVDICKPLGLRYDISPDRKVITIE